MNLILRRVPTLFVEEPGGVTLNIEVQGQDEPQLLITIEDTGVGIPFEVQDRLFKNSLVQADSSTT